MRVIIAILLMVGLSGCGTIINSVPDGLLDRLPQWLEPYLEPYRDRVQPIDTKAFCANPVVRPDVNCEGHEEAARSKLIEKWDSYRDTDKFSCKLRNNGSFETLKCLDPAEAEKIEKTHGNKT